MKNCVYIATSLDGFIAGQHGELDWLPTPSEGDDFGYEQFIATVDTIVLGRKSFDAVLKFPSFPYENLKLVLVVTNNASYRYGGRPNVEVLCSPKSPDFIKTYVKQKLKDSTKNIYVDGGMLIQWFLHHNAIDEMTITRVPVLLGHGVPLFSAIGEVGPIKYELIKTSSFKCGSVMSTYRKKTEQDSL